MIVMDEKIIATWFIVLSDESDYMAAISWANEESMKAGKGEIDLVYRFRYYDKERPNAEPFAGIDKKNWYSGKVEAASKEEALTKMRGAINILASVVNQKPDEIVNTGGVEQFINELASKPWAHMKKEKMGEA